MKWLLLAACAAALVLPTPAHALDTFVNEFGQECIVYRINHRHQRMTCSGYHLFAGRAITYTCDSFNYPATERGPTRSWHCSASLGRTWEGEQ